ncbi:single-stranded-DNA-specific exonuclease RecJ [Peptoniphilus sp. KCTC 25270]|uniref:single-stranded-DNA-specific exonuclease RecJ n=1 Tax=Peptoniphilus sp. KCTC 25270 TaxID=2897414 RepID=UPI001E487307|nr:single-stranded-DNA-specific exonuclease RecJ [Peptoniphilus sp. KCTC 25270]MCD1147039.1 single-stranded-DNA-specific exonuclease RecJ [Peptoniphilus sp. KCTC 25270]
MAKWFIKKVPGNSKVDFLSLGINEIEYQILLNRGIETKEEILEFLKPNPRNFHSSVTMKDMIKAGNLFMEARMKKSKIRIVGDYDVDGVMATTILFLGLKGLGYEVDYKIPHRIKDGYGLNLSMVEEAKEDGIGMILTCDNGISAHEAIHYGKKIGVKMVVTDHHEIPYLEEENIRRENLPEADAIINPKQSACRYPYKNLCGAAVAYKFIHYLYTVQGKIQEMDSDFIGFAAIATVCDVMELKGENRTIVKLGLNRLNQSEHVGLKALKEACGIKSDISGYHLGFVLGPTINSAGRLDSAEKALKLFLTKDAMEAKEIATELRKLNGIRQQMTQDAMESFETQINQSIEKGEMFCILKDETIHESIAGIIAGKVKGRLNRPTIVLTKGKDGLKGSGRSVEGVDIVQEIKKSEEFLLGFGGHKMACGVSLKEEDFEGFKESVLKNVEYSEAELEPIVRVDGLLSLADVKIPFIERLNIFAPFGNGNESPLFGVTDLKISNLKLLGKNNNVLSIQLTENGRIYQGILFQGAEEFLEKYEENKTRDYRLDLVYSPKINNFRNQMTVQFEVKDFRFR